MTKELAARLKHGMQPFDGITLAVESISLVDLREHLALTVHELHKEFAHFELGQNQDWHLHDGIINEETPATWQEVLGWTESTDGVMRGWYAEDYCHRTVFPVSFDWVIRYSLDEEIFQLQGQPDPLKSVWDFSAKPELVERVFELVKGVGSCKHEITTSLTWFHAHGYTSDYF